MPTQGNRSATITIRILPELKKKLEHLAEQDRRTLSSYVELVLEQHAEQSGKRR